MCCLCDDGDDGDDEEEEDKDDDHKDSTSVVYYKTKENKTVQEALQFSSSTENLTMLSFSPAATPSPMCSGSLFEDQRKKAFSSYLRMAGRH